MATATDPHLTTEDLQRQNQKMEELAHRLLVSIIREAESCKAHGDGSVKLQFDNGKLRLVRTIREFTHK